MVSENEHNMYNYDEGVSPWLVKITNTCENINLNIEIT